MSIFTNPKLHSGMAAVAVTTSTFARIVRAAASKHVRPLFLDIRKAYGTVWRDGLMFYHLQRGNRKTGPCGVAAAVEITVKSALRAPYTALLPHLPRGRARGPTVDIPDR